MLCPVCGELRTKTHTGLILNRIDVDYWKCSQCAFWGVAKPTWLDEAYSSAIAATDTGLVARNLQLAQKIPPVLMRLNSSPDAEWVDWAGGYGLFVRLMRDAGFQFYWQDDYAENLFAQTYGYEKAQNHVSAVTAFEVFEHVEDPLAFIRTIIEATNCPTIIFSTILHDQTYDPKWWYLSPETGQHISFYSQKTLEIIAKKIGMRLYSYDNIHMLTTVKLSPLQYRVLVGAPRLLHRLFGRRNQSLTWLDHRAAVDATNIRTIT